MNECFIILSEEQKINQNLCVYSGARLAVNPRTERAVQTSLWFHGLQVMPGLSRLSGAVKQRPWIESPPGGSDKQVLEQLEQRGPEETDG